MKFDRRAGATDLEVKEIDVKEADVSPPRRPVRHREWGAATLFLLLALGGLVAGRLGHLWPAFDVFAQFGMQFLIAALCFSFAVLLPRFKAFSGLVLLVFALLGYGAWPHLTSNTATPLPAVSQDGAASGERILRVAHFNTFIWNHDVDAQASEIMRLNADVIDLVEFDRSKMPILFKLQSAYPFQYQCTDTPYCNLAILSRYPITGVAANVIKGGPPMIMARLGGAMAGTSVIGVHFTRFPHSRWQLRQALSLVKWLETQQGNIILMGDFNATPFSRITSTISSSAGLVRQTLKPTWPSTIGLPQLAIDHIFTSPAIRRVEEPMIGNNAGSDHYPVTMVLGVPRP